MIRSQFIYFLTLLIFALTIVTCKQESSQENNKGLVNSSKATEEKREQRTFGSKDLIATEGRKDGNVLHVPPQKSKDHTEAYRLIYEGLFTKADKVGQSTAMSMYVFNKEGTEIYQYPEGEINGLVLALEDNPNVKIEILSHSNSAVSVTHSRANSVKQLLLSKGVSPEKISSRGMGRENLAKAAGNMISIKFLEI